jgi:hypothetical protein
VIIKWDGTEAVAGAVGPPPDGPFPQFGPRQVVNGLLITGVEWERRAEEHRHRMYYRVEGKGRMTEEDVLAAGAKEAA